METAKLNVELSVLNQMNNEDRKRHAKQLYWQYANITDIAKALDIKLPTLKTWIYGTNSKKDQGWKVERELDKNQLLKDLSSDKRGMVHNMVNGSLYLLFDFVEKTKQETVMSGQKIDIKTAEKLTNILSNLHKMIQDEKDMNDDSDFTKPSNTKELKERLSKADPFDASEDEDVIVVG